MASSSKPTYQVSPKNDAVGNNNVPIPLTPSQISQSSNIPVSAVPFYVELSVTVFFHKMSYHRNR